MVTVIKQIVAFVVDAVVVDIKHDESDNRERDEWIERGWVTGNIAAVVAVEVTRSDN